MVGIQSLNNVSVNNIFFVCLVSVLNDVYNIFYITFKLKINVFLVLYLAAFY